MESIDGKQPLEQEVKGVDEKMDAGEVLPSAGLGGDLPESVEETTIAYFRANKVPGAGKDANRIYAVFNESRDVSLYPQFMPKGTKLDFTDSEFCEEFEFTMPWGPSVKMCGMVQKGARKPHGLVRFLYEDGNIIEATAVDGKFVGLYTRVQKKADAIYVLLWGPDDHLQYLARINYSTKDWQQYGKSHGKGLKFLEDRVAVVLRAFGAKV